MTASARTRDGVRIVYDDAGSGSPALVCMPGWASDRFQFSNPLLPVLAREHRTIVLDWRGHGDSQRPQGDFGYAQLVDDVVAVIDAAGIDRFVAVAAAHGAWAAIDLRTRIGERLSGLVAISWMMLGAPPPFIEGLRRMQDDNTWADVQQQLFSMWTGRSDNQGVKEQISRMAGYPAEMWMRAGREIERAFSDHGPPVQALSSLNPPLPTLHLYAQPDDPALLQAQQKFAQDNPWFRVERIDAQTHFPQFEAPELVAGHITSFAATLRSG